MTQSEQDRHESRAPRTVAVIGGGLAGIAAAEAARRRGEHVELFEWSRVLGGRLASMAEPHTQQWIDNGQHVLFGCCRETLALNERLGLAGFFDRYDATLFAGTDGKRWELAPSSFLPSRWQLVPAFLKMPFLSFGDRVATGLLLRKLGKMRFVPRKGSTESSTAQVTSVPVGNREPRSQVFADWLKAEGASSAAVTKFWSPLVFSTLSDTVDKVCLSAVQKVVQDALLGGGAAWATYIPNRSLRSIYGDAAREALERLGVVVHLGKRVARLYWNNFADAACTEPIAQDDDTEAVASRVTALELADGTVRTFDRYILAIPSHRVWGFLENSELDSYAEMLELERFEPGAITCVHLWCNRRILPDNRFHCAILGNPGQVLFCPDTRQRHAAQGEADQVAETPPPARNGIYHVVVISASHRLLDDDEMISKGREQLVARVVEQLQATFPETFGHKTEAAQVEHWRVTTVFDAVFSPHPDVYSNRPVQETPLGNLALAGDWTQTDWPATMEGAVLSGQRAVAALEE